MKEQAIQTNRLLQDAPPDDNITLQLPSDITMIQHVEDNAEGVNMLRNFSKKQQAGDNRNSEVQEDKAFAPKPCITEEELVAQKQESLRLLNKLNDNFTSFEEVLKESFKELNDMLAQTSGEPREVMRGGTQEGRQVALHHNVQCRYCKQIPIEGPRYQCVECADLNMCKKCFEAYPHQHLIITYPTNVDPEMSNDIAKLYQLKKSIENEKEESLKRRILRNLASKYDDEFYENFMQKYKDLNLSDFTERVLQIFD